VLFNITKGQLPENMAPAPHGALDVALNGAGEVGQVSAAGKLKVLATLPPAADGGVNTPDIKSAFTAGMVRAANGTIYTNYSTGTVGQTGIYRIKPGGTPELIVELPAAALANGLALDPKTHELYAADSSEGIIWSAPAAGGTAAMWASGPAFQPTKFLGANGIKFHDNAIWVSNTDAGTILRIPIESDGSAGTPSTFASGLATIDDFNFVGKGNEIAAALDIDDQVDLVHPNGTYKTVLDGSDGLEGPTSIVVRGDKMYVASGAYFTGQNPNILVARLAK
jgi:sugar lactone lactonase YvrE